MSTKKLFMILALCLISTECSPKAKSTEITIGDALELFAIKQTLLEQQNRNETEAAICKFILGHTKDLDLGFPNTSNTYAPTDLFRALMEDRPDLYEDAYKKLRLVKNTFTVFETAKYFAQQLSKLESKERQEYFNRNVIENFLIFCEKACQTLIKKYGPAPDAQDHDLLYANYKLQHIQCDTEDVNRRLTTATLYEKKVSPEPTRRAIKKALRQELHIIQKNCTKIEKELKKPSHFSPNNPVFKTRLQPLALKTSRTSLRGISARSAR